MSSWRIFPNIWLIPNEGENPYHIMNMCLAVMKEKTSPDHRSAAKAFHLYLELAWGKVRNPRTHPGRRLRNPGFWTRGPKGVSSEVYRVHIFTSVRSLSWSLPGSGRSKPDKTLENRGRLDLSSFFLLRSKREIIDWDLRSEPTSPARIRERPTASERLCLKI